MSNSATVLWQVPVAFESFSNFKASSGSTVNAISCSFDTINTALEVYKPQSDAIPAILGWQHCHDADHVVTVQTGDADGSFSNPADLIVYRFKAGNGIGKELNGWPLLVGKKGKSIGMKVSVQPMTALLYVAEFRLFRL